MNFLHRLHPARALETGAARPDIPPLFAPRFAPVAAPPSWPAPAAAASPLQAAAQAQRSVVKPLATAQPVPAMPAVPPAAVGKSPQMSADESNRVHANPVPVPMAGVRGADRSIGHEPPARSVGAARPDRGSVTPAAVAPKTPGAPAVAPTRAASRALPPPAPLRAQATPRASVAAPPTVVRVSIDRLDVRLPAEHAAAPAPAPRRPRAAAGPSLVDYLRGNSGGAR